MVVKNLNDKKIYLSRTLSGTPAPGLEQELLDNKEKGISLEIKTIQANSDTAVTSPFKRGEDFRMVVTVKNSKLTL